MICGQDCGCIDNSECKFATKILVKQEGEEKAETVREAAEGYYENTVINVDGEIEDIVIDAVIWGANWQSSQQSKRIAELEGRCLNG